jgi:putative neutral zinc metallopeptidase
LEIILFILGIIVVVYAQSHIMKTYHETMRIRNEKMLSGQEVARKILDANGLEDIYVVQVSGELTDHYDPSRNVIRLSNHVFQDDSIASLAVAAHECGHAIQRKEGYLFYRLRSALVPVVNLVSYFGYFVIIISAFAGITAYLLLGMVMLLSTLIFQLVTLPVEIDASKRGMKEIEKLNLAKQEEMPNVANMLKAAAMTYVASLASTILNLLRLIFMYRNRD